MDSNTGEMIKPSKTARSETTMWELWIKNYTEFDGKSKWVLNVSSDSFNIIERLAKEQLSYGYEVMVCFKTQKETNNG